MSDETTSNEHADNKTLDQVESRIASLYMALNRAWIKQHVLREKEKESTVSGLKTL